MLSFSKKYAHLQPDLVERIGAEEAAKYKSERESIKAVKNALYLLYGAYAEENSHKKANALIEALRADAAFGKEQAAALLCLHASTRERLNVLDIFYKFIFKTIKQTIAENAADKRWTVLDLGCGYNPFSLPWFKEYAALDTYYAYDIDLRLAGLTNRFFTSRHLPQAAGCMDLITQTPAESADITFLLKLLPVLDKQRKGRAVQLIMSLNTRFAVISYPLKSLSGREKGMSAHYEKAFDALMVSLEGWGLIDRAEIGRELVYVMKNNRAVSRV